VVKLQGFSGGGAGVTSLLDSTVPAVSVDDAATAIAIKREIRFFMINPYLVDF
jgi:hypothetical protein